MLGDQEVDYVDLQLENQLEKAKQQVEDLTKTNKTLQEQVKKSQEVKSTAEKERDKLKKEHANCLTTIQALEKEKQTLQNQLDEILTGAPQVETNLAESQTETQLEAKVQQNIQPFKK